MRRKIYDELVEWKNKSGRMPLIVGGARQVEKSYIPKEFGAREFDNFIIVNLETDKALAQQFEENITPGPIIRYLEAAHSQRIIPGKTLVIFDEIQACAKALTSLKYFQEEAPEYHVAAADIQNRILNEYIADMAKYANPATSVKIRACYESIPAQLAKENRKFQYSVVKRGATSTIFGEAIEWLNYAGVTLKCKKITQGTIPIKAYVDLSDFKLYMSDTGMLTMQSGLPPATILSTLETDIPFLGTIAENYVAQCFAANGMPLYYLEER